MMDIDDNSPIILLGRIKRFIFTTNSAIWFEKDLTENLVDFKPKISLEIDFYATDQVIEWLKKQKLNWLINNNEIETAKKYNHFWPTICYNENIIGILKVGFKKVYIADYDQIIDLPEKIAFLNDIYVLNDKRDKGVAKFLTVVTIKHLKSKGFLKVKLHVPKWNRASISVCKYLGFKKTSYIRFFRIFGIPFFSKKSLKNFSKTRYHKLSQGDILGG